MLSAGAMTNINEQTAQCAYLKIIEKRHEGECQFMVTIEDKVQREKFEREIRSLTKQLNSDGRSCTVIINQPTT